MKSHTHLLLKRSSSILVKITVHSAATIVILRDAQGGIHMRDSHKKEQRDFADYGAFNAFLRSDWCRGYAFFFPCSIFCLMFLPSLHDRLLILLILLFFLSLVPVTLNTFPFVDHKAILLPTNL